MLLKTGTDCRIRNIIFDFGNVLLDIDIQLTLQAFRKLGLHQLRPEEIHPHNAGVFLELELGNIDSGEFVAALQACVAQGQPVPSREQVLGAWNDLLLPYDWRRFEMLDLLRHTGYRIFLLSNTNLPHREFFTERFDRENPARRTLESYFDRCFWSDAMRQRKPTPGIYQTVLLEAGIRPEETLFVDDNKPNTDAAALLGIHTYHLDKAAGESVFDLF